MSRLHVTFARALSREPVTLCHGTCDTWKGSVAAPSRRAVACVTLRSLALTAAPAAPCIRHFVCRHDQKLAGFCWHDELVQKGGEGVTPRRGEGGA